MHRAWSLHHRLADRVWGRRVGGGPALVDSGWLQRALDGSTSFCCRRRPCQLTCLAAALALLSVLPVAQHVTGSILRQLKLWCPLPMLSFT